MVNILITVHSFPPDYTGAGLRVKKLINRMGSKYPHNFQVLCFKRKESKYSDNDSDISRISSIKKGILLPFSLFRLFLISFIYLYRNRKRIDVIHLFSWDWLNMFILLNNTVFFHKKTILEVTLDKVDDPISLLSSTMFRLLIKSFTKFLLKGVDWFIVQTEYAFNSCIEAGFEKDRIWLRPNPVDEEEFFSNPNISKKELRSRLLIKDRLTFLNVGIIQPRKNQLALIKGINLLKKYPLQLILVGPKDDNFPEYYKAIVDYINNYNLKEKVFIVGKKDDVREYMELSDVFLFASNNEGFGNVLAEALVMGLPVITTYLSGINQYINPFVGRVVNKGVVDNNLPLEYLKYLEEIIKGVIKFDSVKVREYGIEHFSAKFIDEKYNDIYTL